MFKTIMPILRCPCCGESFILTEDKIEEGEILEGKITCKAGHSYHIREGIIDFASDEQEATNNWSEIYKEVDYEELDREIEAHKSDGQKKIEKEHRATVIEKTTELKEGYLLDIASGRGMLLRELLETVSPKVHIISTDLSFEVLKYDRIKFKEKHPEVKRTYIACDATNFPMKAKSVDMACTYMGIMNMINLAEAGIRDCARILKDDAALIEAVIYQKEGTKAYEEAKKVLKENGIEGIEQMVIREEIMRLHKKYFHFVEEKISCEEIAEGQEGDLFPGKGEWFANVVLDCR